MMLLVPVTRAGIYPRSLAWTEPSCRVLKLYLPFRWLMSLGLIPTKWLSFPCAYLVTFHPSFKSACHCPLQILPPDQHEFVKACGHVKAKQDEPTIFEAWGHQMEKALDQALRHTEVAHEHIHYCQTTGLKKAYRGRCQPRKPQPRHIPTTAKPPRSGEYHPSLEVHSFATSKKVKQVRRLDSLCRGLKRVQQGYQEPPSLLMEWRSILRCQAFKGNFPKWAMSHPEIGPLHWNLPSLDMASTILRIARHETNIAIQTWLCNLATKVAILPTFRCKIWWTHTSIAANARCHKRHSDMSDHLLVDNVKWAALNFSLYIFSKGLVITSLA